MEQQFDFTVSDLASKWTSKTEFYNVLTREGGLYLPLIKDSTLRFIRSLMRGEKEYVKCRSIKVIQVPQYKGLTVRDIIKFAKTKIDINSYLPDYEYLKEPNREWLWNVVNSLIPNEFQKYIKIWEEKRREELLQSSNLAIRVKPEFLDIFKSSQSVSTIKGKPHFLTRNPKITKDKISISILNEEKRN